MPVKNIVTIIENKQYNEHVKHYSLNKNKLNIGFESVCTQRGTVKTKTLQTCWDFTCNNDIDGFVRNLYYIYLTKLTFTELRRNINIFSFLNVLRQQYKCGCPDGCVAPHRTIYLKQRDFRRTSKKGNKIFWLWPAVVVVNSVEWIFSINVK